MKKARYIILGVFMLLFVACGQQHEAKSIVKDFVENNLAEGYQLNEVNILRIDSTRHVNDSIVNSMRQSTQNSPLPYKSKIDYISKDNEKTLMACRTEYKINDKTYKGVFYLNKSLTGVIAFYFYQE